MDKADVIAALENCLRCVQARSRVPPEFEAFMRANIPRASPEGDEVRRRAARRIPKPKAPAIVVPSVAAKF